MASAAALPPPAGRETLVDALRALALFGVLLVNAVSYPGGPYGSPLGVPAPAGSGVAALLFALVAWLVQGKAYPLLAFLFGYSLALALRVRSEAGLAYRRRRMQRLLVLGVLHGALVYAGDILTMYSIAALVLLAWARLRLRELVSRLLLFVVLALLVVGADVVLVALAPPPLPAADGLATYAGVRTPANFLAVNLNAYLGNVVAGVALFLPEVMLLMLAGLVAGRLRGLTHRRWQGLRGRLLRRLLVPALALNLGYAAFMTTTVLNGSPLHWVGLALGTLAGWLLSAVLCAGLAHAWHRGAAAPLAWIAPLGRYSLSVYVGHSLLCAIVLSGAGWAVRVGTVGLAAWGLGLWLGCAIVAAWAWRRGFRGPLEQWMIRA